MLSSMVLCRCVCRFLYTYSNFEWLYLRYERYDQRETEKIMYTHNIKIAWRLLSMMALYIHIHMYMHYFTYWDLFSGWHCVCAVELIEKYSWSFFFSSYNMIFMGVCLLLVVMVMHVHRCLKFCLVAVVFLVPKTAVLCTRALSLFFFLVLAFVTSIDVNVCEQRTE